jgi:hypothetical protein
MATVLENQSGFYADGRVRFGVDDVTHAFVPNPTDTGLLDIGATDAKVKQIHLLNGISGALAAGTYLDKATIVTLTEDITLATGAATTDSTTNLLPANSLILAVTSRVTTAITTAVNYTLGDAAVAARFAAANTGVTLGSTGIGIAQWHGVVSATNAGPTQAADAKIRITCNANPGAGKIRISVIALVFNAPTS